MLPTKKRLLPADPSGVNSSITSCGVPAGTVAISGAVTTVPSSALLTLTVARPIKVSEPGNPVGKFDVV